MLKEKSIEILAAAHCLEEGKLDKGNWSWSLIIDGEETPRLFQEDLSKSPEFFGKIKPYLPKDYSKYFVSIPVQQGDEWLFKIPLRETKNPEKVEKLLREYFPDVYK